MDWWKSKDIEIEEELSEFQTRMRAWSMPSRQWQPSSQVQTKPYELPKRWAESAMETVGGGMAKIPLLPKALEFVAPVFEFIHEKLEKPFAAIVTSPFSPNLPWRTGESWLDHQRREYELWKAPTYVKGLAEFAMPLWWMPWLGWAGKGAKSLGIGNKMARALERMPQAGKVKLPADEILDNTLFKKDFFKTVALWSEGKGPLGGVVRAIGGPSAFVSGTAGDAIGITKRALVKRAVITDMRHGVRGLLTPRLQKYGDPIKVLQLDDAGRIGAVTVKDGSSNYLSDVFEGYVRNPDNYSFATKEAKGFVDDAIDVVNEVRGLALAEGVKIPKEFVFHRMVRGVYTEGEKSVLELSEWGSRFDIGRHLKTMKEGAERATMPVVYENNPMTVINGTIDHYIKAIATKRFDNEVGKLGMRAIEKFATKHPAEQGMIEQLTAKATSAKYAKEMVSSIITRKGTTLPPATMAKIRRGLPEVAEQLDEAFKFTPPEADRIISALGRDIWREAKIRPAEFKAILSQYVKTPGRILMSELDDAVRSLNITHKTAVTAIERAYKESYRTLSATQKEIFRGVREQADNIMTTAKDEVRPLVQFRNEFLRPYREGRQILGREEKVFARHPAFRGKIFPKEVVDMAEPALVNAGNQWIKRLGQVSGTGRMLVAAMDFSAPFIQGLAVLGRNPLAWARGVMRQFEFFVKPENVFKYMDDPAIKALHAEMVAHGASLTTFEFFEALKPLQRITGKVGEKVIGQTYGRAEAAFTGFGMIARDNMWKALRRRALRPDGTLDEAIARELLRSIDRMTGVMSTEALAIGRTQRDFENAFMFFAPRYTRASLTYVGDVLKGGISGAEARKSLGALMASGGAMYYGICKVLGQQPNFNINSAQFMTVKIGDDHLGIGGILYGLGRFGAGVLATATDDEVPFRIISVHDNPFFKFMFQRSSPLTGFMINAAIEQKNYFGEPLESPADWGKFMAEKVLPIAMQRAILEPEHRQLAVFGAEVMGGRTFPKSAWELQRETRDRIAMDEYGMEYKVLPKLNKREIDKRPEVTVFQEEIDERTTQIGRTLSVGFLERQRERDDARFMYLQALEQAQGAVEAGLMSGYEFKEQMQLAGYGLGMTYQHIDSNPRYKGVLEKLREPKDLADEYIGDVAYDELVSALYGGVFEDKYGIFNYDAYNQFREMLRLKYGDNVMAYIEALEMQRRAELPALAQEYKTAQDVMKPYWEVQKRVEEMFGKFFAESPKGQRVIARLRKAKRIENPELERYYQMFYAR